MVLKELKTGTIFNIENTPTYPKLKTNDGYVDMRDDIINNNGNCDDKNVIVMSFEDINNVLGDGNDEELQDWIDSKKKRYL